MATVNIINGENGLRGNLINDILKRSSLIIIILSELYIEEYLNNEYNQKLIFEDIVNYLQYDDRKA